MNAIKRTKGLGRGLEALLGPSGDDVNKDMGEQVMTLPLGKLQAGKYQPRSRMDESSLMELAESIKSQGIMQPILVRPIGSGNTKLLRASVASALPNWRVWKKYLCWCVLCPTNQRWLWR